MRRIASTAIILDKRRIRKDGTFPVKLRVTYSRKQKYYSTGFYLEKEEFDKIGPKARGKYKELKISLGSIEEKAHKIINDLPTFNFAKFENRLLTKSADNQNVYKAYQSYINKLLKEDRIGTASSYLCSMKSIKDFKNMIKYEEVTPEFLKSYEKWMISKDKSLTTVGFYLRCLRAIFNIALEEGHISKFMYPFGKRRYQIPFGSSTKKSLSLSNIEKIFNYQASIGSTEHRAKDLWIFSYLCNGINIKDIARLKYKNIDGDNLVFIRSKTEKTIRTNRKTIVAVLTPIANEIIDRWGTKPKRPGQYIFPILYEGISARQEASSINNVTRGINTYIKRIAKKVGIKDNVSTYTARHSFSTILKRSGASIEFISESLGHQDVKTTESYLGSFEDSKKREYAAKLTDFTGKTR